MCDGSDRASAEASSLSSPWSAPADCGTAVLNRQGEDFGRRREWIDDQQAENNPVVSPTDQGLGATGDERIVVHTGTIERQPALSAEGVIYRPEQRSSRSKDRDNELSQDHGQGIDIPGGMAEEAMEPRPMAVADVAAGEDDLSDVAVSLGENPASDDLNESPGTSEP